MQCVGIEIVVQNDFRSCRFMVKLIAKTKRVSQEEFNWKEAGLSFRPRTIFVIISISPKNFLVTAKLVILTNLIKPRRFDV